MTKPECDLYRNGKCAKLLNTRKPECQVSNREWLDSLEYYDDMASFISVSDMCRRASIFGNDYIGLTIDDINRILNGEVLHISGEYGIFIGLLQKEYDKHESNME